MRFKTKIFALLGMVLLFSLLNGTPQENHEEKPFVIIIPSFNNKEFYVKNLNSVFSQKYENYRVIYIDDDSLDGTACYVKNYIKEKKLEKKITLIENSQRLTALANLYQGIHLCKPEEIVAILDGDDWFSHDRVLERLNQEYSDPDVWLTYGQYVEFHGENEKILTGICEPLPDEVIEKGSIRHYPKWVTSHLKTFYAGLFHQIKKEDLVYEGDFFKSAADVAIMFPLIELAIHHIRFIPDILYIYNRTNAINDDKVNRTLQYHANIELSRRERCSPTASYIPSEEESPLKNIYILRGQWGPLFAEDDPTVNRDDCLAPIIVLRQYLREHNIKLHDASSLKDLNDPLAIVSFDVPSKEGLKDILKYPYEARVLFLWEPPSTAPNNYDKSVHEHFYRIYTWDDELVDNKKYYKLHYPFLRPMIADTIPYEKKKLCCAITANKHSFHPDQLYSERIKTYRFFDQKHPEEFSLFGKWWDKEQFPTYCGEVTRKVDAFKNFKFCICYENIKGIKGYITEKIFDAFHAGCVPIYLGAPNICEEVPENCFIDRRLFNSEEELYQFLKNMTKEAYEGYLDRIREYLQTTKARQYSIDAFVRKISSAFLKDETPYYFCTAADSGYFDPLLNLIGSIHRWNFDRLGEIAVFDIGLEHHQVEYLKKIQKIKVYSIEKTHPDLLKPFLTRNWGKPVPGWYAWKPVCIKQGLEIFPDLLWIDGGTIIRRPIDQLFRHMRREGYFFHNGSPWHMKKQLTHHMISKHNLDNPEYSWILADNTHGLEAGLMGITRVVEFDFVRPVYALSKDLKNFEDDGTAPEGFGYARHDLSVFSIFALKNEYQIFHHFEDGRNDIFLRGEGGEKVPFHISCNQADCKEGTHIYHSRKSFNPDEYTPFIRMK